MVRYLVIIFSLLLIVSCNMQDGPTSTSEWHEYKYGLKGIVTDIIDNNGEGYIIGKNDIPSNVSFPFYSDFYINIRKSDSLNVNLMTVMFYTDKGLMDHYSAFIYTNDSNEIEMLESNVADEGNDYKLEQNWYLIND